MSFYFHICPANFQPWFFAVFIMYLWRRTLRGHATLLQINVIYTSCLTFSLLAQNLTSYFTAKAIHIHFPNMPCPLPILSRLHFIHPLLLKSGLLSHKPSCFQELPPEMNFFLSCFSPPLHGSLLLHIQTSSNGENVSPNSDSFQLPFSPPSQLQNLLNEKTILSVTSSLLLI